MARDSEVTLTEDGAWVELTAGNVTNLSFQVKGDNHILVQATTGSAPSAGSTNAYQYNAILGANNISLAALWPGVSGANRVWARTVTGATIKVKVSHA